MQGSNQIRSRNRGPRRPVPEEEKLERALVAGLMLDVVLETPGWPDDPQSRRRLIKSRLLDSLVAHLAGHISLDRFRLLVLRLNQWFPYYYPLMPPLAPPPEERQTCSGELGQPPATAGPSTLVRHDLLQEWLQQAVGKILPRRPQRKLQPNRLEEFLQRTRGCWFQAKIFAQTFAIDRKTAWEYLQKFQDAGLLTHNRARSAAVRYRLADRFLKVQVAALQQQVALALPGLPQPWTAQVTEWLAATAGEPFWEDRWPARLAGGRREEIINSLKTAAVLEVVCRVAERRLLRLPRRWLRSQED